MQKQKYITNKDLLREIHNSKITYCYYEKPEYAAYDAIVMSVDDITPELIEKTLTKKMTVKGKNAEPKFFTVDDLVFRVMTHEHIPLDPDRKRKARNTDKSYARTNFPPFKHYIIRKETPIEVGRSHWKGDLVNGEFCLDKGYMTASLAQMFMLLVQRYSSRGNWRGYCVDESTEALTKRGWLKWDEINEMDTILSYDGGQLKWSKIKSIFRDEFNGKMHRLTVTGMDALVTPGHKFVTQSGLKAVEFLSVADVIILSGHARDYVGLTPDELSDMGTSVSVGDIDFHGGLRLGNSDDPNVPTEPYRGMVWCPETEYGSFMCRRNGYVYLTGNSYVDEMRSHALLQLSQMALQFDESKSDNPFAFYTTTIRNSFTRILNLERRNQDIRDDMLIVAGVSPSHTRQIENELEHRFAEQERNRPGVPGRRPVGRPPFAKKVVPTP